jgi:hydroxymethylglutaryl-CoA lyase
MGGIGGQPANFMDGVPVRGTGEYYYKDPNIVGLVSLEDMLVMMDEMRINTNVDIDRMLALGKKWEKTIGRRLRSESILNGRIPKKPRLEYKRKGLSERKAKLKEEANQRFPKDWPEKVSIDKNVSGK